MIPLLILVVSLVLGGIATAVWVNSLAHDIADNERFYKTVKSDQPYWRKLGAVARTSNEWSGKTWILLIPVAIASAIILAFPSYVTLMSNNPATNFGIYAVAQLFSVWFGIKTYAARKELYAEYKEYGWEVLSFTDLRTNITYEVVHNLVGFGWLIFVVCIALLS